MNQSRINGRSDRGPRRRGACLAVVLAAGWAIPAAAVLAPVQPASAQPAAAQADKAMPIRNITLYRSGVGFFERRGTVQGQEQVQLKFATDQINDILKSMVILIDPKQGRVESVSYGSKDPLSRRLSSFGVDISDNPDLARLLSRLRGARISVVTADGRDTGTILGVEARPVPAGKDEQVVETPFVTLVTEAGIKAVDLTRVASFEILDKDLAAELGKALAALAEQRADRVKTVDLSFESGGAAEAVVAYVHEMPVWKTSYRLVLPEMPEGRKDPKDQGGQPTIQGWAIVENTTDEDWENVRLGLVAGRPVSFQMDLYEPLHVARPEIPVPMVPGVRPREYAGGASFDDRRELDALATKAPPAPEAPGRYRMGRAAGPEEKARGVERAGLEMSGDALQAYAAASQAQGGEIGEVFQYQLKEPVSIARQRSAMLPILASPLEGRRVSIYNRADGSEHPMRGVELKNTSGMQLMPGPISVFDGAAYAGDAQIGHVTLGDKRLLAYSVDLDVQALVRDENRSDVRRLRIVSGLIEQTSKQEYRVSYAFKNKDEKRPRTILVEQAKMGGGWVLASPQKAMEETQELYRFELPVAPGASERLDVVQERTDRQMIQVASFDFPTLLAYSRDGKVSKAVVDAVRKAADMQAAINETQRRIQLLDQERTSIDQDQGRLRQNMANIARDTELYRRYMTKLNEQETRLENIREEREKEQASLTEQRRALEDYVRGLNVE